MSAAVSWRGRGLPAMAILLMVAVVGLLAVACANAPFVWVSELPPEKAQPTTIAVGDEISVVVKNQATMSGEFTVQADGRYVQPLVGHIHVAGLTPEQAAKRLAQYLKGLFDKPETSIALATPHALRVSVLGEVQEPGNFEIVPDETMLTVLARAGGLTEFGDRNSIYVVRKRPRNQRIRFRYQDLTGAQPAALAFRFHDGDVVVVE